MAGKTTYSVRTVREAIAGTRGNKVAIAEKLRCTRQTVDNLLKRYPELVPVLEDERESMVDVAENKLNELVNAGEIRAILFVLETMGKNRGWAKRTEITGANGSALTISDETVAYLRKMNVDPTDVVREFEAMVRANAEMKIK